MRILGADLNLLQVPGGSYKELDYVLLVNILLTAWRGLTNLGLQTGDAVTVFGAGIDRAGTRGVCGF